MSHYKSYPAYKDSGVEWVGNVPEHWDVKRLRHVASFKNSNVDKKSYDGQQHVRLCNYTDVYYNEFITQRLDFMQATASADEIEQFSLKKGDVIITKDSEDPSDIGIPAIVSDDLDGVVCGYHLTVIRDDDFETSRVIHRALQAKPTQAHFFVEAPGITRYGLNQDAIGDTPICLPPPQERKNLADHIDRETSRIDALIAKKSRFIELLQEKRQALITHAVTKGLDPNVKMKDSGVEWIGGVPEHWGVVQVRHVAALGSGHTPSRSHPEWWEDCYIPWFTLADIWQVRREGRRYIFETEENISDLGIANSSATLHPAGSVMLSRTASVGFPAIMGCDMATSQDFAVWRCGARLNNEFLYLVLLGMRQELSRLMIGSTHKTIYMPDIEAFRMPLPSRAEQLAIIEHIDRETKSMDALAERTRRSIDLLKERRAAFITAAVTGQIDFRSSAEN
ncbi:restriction endonuclease subunit S [Thiomonas sp. FB-Cd]|uniref:restriction endonuclease subunit S n=1 Tax=Thiomonas sp. FB-Cd TaxID=1158292 RepID=UPI0004DF597C|nr:restriction endonuclease subunit S [Thiomonas sp. FB-Cd]